MSTRPAWRSARKPSRSGISNDQDGSVDGSTSRCAWKPRSTCQRPPRTPWSRHWSRSRRSCSFSAAIPLQGGAGHINEQWPSYWVELFARRGYVAIDAIRPAVWSNERVAVWYAQNCLLFASDEAVKERRALSSAREASRPGQLDLVHPGLYLLRLSGSSWSRSHGPTGRRPPPSTRFPPTVGDPDDGQQAPTRAGLTGYRVAGVASPAADGRAASGPVARPELATEGDLAFIVQAR